MAEPAPTASPPSRSASADACTPIPTSYAPPLYVGAGAEVAGAFPRRSMACVATQAGAADVPRVVATLDGFAGADGRRFVQAVDVAKPASA
jgi:hypothetical protein